MTQEEKELVLKDLCARLPYGVICDCGFTAQLKLVCPDGDYCIIQNSAYAIETVKPYLRPMSSMTEEEKKEHDFYCGYKPYDENVGESYLTEYDMPDYMDFLLQHHLDYRGLIEKGLALEAPE